MKNCKYNINGYCLKLSDDTGIQPCIESPCPIDDEQKVNNIKVKQFIKEFEKIFPFPATDLKSKPEVIRSLIYSYAQADPRINELPYKYVNKALEEYADERFQRFINLSL